MKFLNLTPHPVKIYDEIGELVLELWPAPNMRTPRVVRVMAKEGDLGGVPVFKPAFSAPNNLPPPQTDTTYIVSRMVKQAVLDRKDVMCPGDALRTPEGVIYGARGLSF